MLVDRWQTLTRRAKVGLALLTVACLAALGVYLAGRAVAREPFRGGVPFAQMTEAERDEALIALLVADLPGPERAIIARLAPPTGRPTIDEPCADDQPAIAIWTFTNDELVSATEADLAQVRRDLDRNQFYYCVIQSSPTQMQVGVMAWSTASTTLGYERGGGWNAIWRTVFSVQGWQVTPGPTLIFN